MFRTLRRKILRLAVVSGAGAAATYFLDKERGPERREQAKAKASSLVGRQAPATDWQPHTATGFEPAPAPTTSPSPAPVVTAPVSVPTVTDILSTPDPAVDVLVVEPGPLTSP